MFLHFHRVMLKKISHFCLIWYLHWYLRFYVKSEYTVGLYPSQNVYQTYLKVFNIYHFLSVDILAQGKIQNSHSPFYSMFCTTKTYNLRLVIVYPRIANFLYIVFLDISHYLLVSFTPISTLHFIKWRLHNCSGCSDMEKLFLNYSSGKVTEGGRAWIEKRWFALAVWGKRERGETWVLIFLSFLPPWANIFQHCHFPVALTDRIWFNLWCIKHQVLLRVRHYVSGARFSRSIYDEL